MYHEKQQENCTDKLIENIDDVKRGSYERAEDRKLISEDGTVYVEKPRSNPVEPTTRKIKIQYLIHLRR